MLKVVRLFMLFVIGTCFHLIATAAVPTCGKVQIFFVNGVWNDHGYDAMNSAVELSSVINEALARRNLPAIANARLIWNQGDGLINDAEEVLLDQPTLYAALIAALPRFIVDSTAASSRKRKAIDAIKAIVLNEIQVNKVPVVLVAHSQGNIMVNEAVKELQNIWKNSLPDIMNIAIVGVGVADKSPIPPLSSNRYDYLTSGGDLIIKPLPGALPTNFERDFVPLEVPYSSPALIPFSMIAKLIPAGHDFVGVYLNPKYLGTFRGKRTSSRDAIGDLFVDAYERVNRAWACVTMTTDPNPSIVDPVFHLFQLG